MKIRAFAFDMLLVLGFLLVLGAISTLSRAVAVLLVGIVLIGLAIEFGGESGGKVDGS